ncbi:Sas10/Utp3/C1D family [Zea mays]|uniref:Sas10/Utp3/C1D family n=1 Tax=Zea mays TaxID=4577 RepID=A0A1D6GRA4_MAIZE|nr:Sas10/Utp3/C1D family [Zea mays]
MAADALSTIPGAVLRNLSDKLYEKRKNAALEIEGIVKQLAMAGEHERISAVISLLTNNFTYSPQTNHRKGGLIGLAAVTVGLTSEAAQHLETCLGTTDLNLWANSSSISNRKHAEENRGLLSASSFDRQQLRKEVVRRVKAAAAGLAIENPYIKEIIDDDADRPKEWKETVGDESREFGRYMRQREEQEKQEAELFTRAPVTKHDKQIEKRIRRQLHGRTGLTEECSAGSRFDLALEDIAEGKVTVQEAINPFF